MRARAEHLRLLEAMDDLGKMELLRGEKGRKRESLTMAGEVCVCVIEVRQIEHASRSHRGPV